MKKLLSLILAAVMLLSLFAGCGTEASEVVASVSEKTAASSEAVPAVEEAEASVEEAAVSAEEPATLENASGIQEVALPLVEEETAISFWLPYPFFVGDMVENLVEDVTVLRELQARTGVTLATLVTEEGNLPTISTLFKTSGAENQGYMVRYDWLDELGLEVPATYAELEAYIEACNSTYGSQGMVLSAEGLDEMLAFGYDCGTEYLVVDGEVKSSLQQDSFREYMNMVSDWYSRGLIYSDFYLYGTDDTLDQMFCSGQLAVDTGRCTSFEMFYGYTDASYSAEYGPMKPVRINAEDEIHYSTTVGSLVKKQDTWSITTACESEEQQIVMALVNYLFSEEGQMLFNWGVEGEAYTLNAEGEPEYTDMMINDPDNPYLFTAYLYASNTASEYAPSIMDVSKQYYSFDDTAWLAYEMYLDDGADGSYNYPAGATLNAEELTDYAALSSDLNTYVETQVLAFITGQTELNDDTWGQFQDTLVSMGIDTMVSYYQAAYDRYEDKVAGLEIA